MQTSDLRSRFCALAAEPQEASGWPEEECDPRLELFRKSARVMPRWEQVMPTLMRSWEQTVLTAWRDVSRVEVLTRELLLLKRRVAALEDASPLTVAIQSLAPEPYEVMRPILAVLRRQDDEYRATFYDANLSASGETEVEAVLNLKDIIVATFELLVGHDRDLLAPGAARQRSVLEKFLRRSD